MLAVAARSMAMAVDDEQQRRRKSSFGLKEAGANKVFRLLEIDNHNLTREQRDHGKVMITEVHKHVIERTDNAHVLGTLAAAQQRLPRMVWLVYLAAEFGLVTKGRDATGVLVFAQPPRFLTHEEIALYYGKSARTVKDYYEDARRVVRDETTSGTPALRED